MWLGPLFAWSSLLTTTTSTRLCVPPRRWPRLWPAFGAPRPGLPTPANAYAALGSLTRCVGDSGAWRLPRRRSTCFSVRPSRGARSRSSCAPHPILFRSRRGDRPVRPQGAARHRNRAGLSPERRSAAFCAAVSAKWTNLRWRTCCAPGVCCRPVRPPLQCNAGCKWCRLCGCGGASAAAACPPAAAGEQTTVKEFRTCFKCEALPYRGEPHQAADWVEHTPRRRALRRAGAQPRVAR